MEKKENRRPHRRTDSGELHHPLQQYYHHHRKEEEDGEEEAVEKEEGVTAQNAKREKQAMAQQQPKQKKRIVDGMTRARSASLLVQPIISSSSSMRQYPHWRTRALDRRRFSSATPESVKRRGDHHHGGRIGNGGAGAGGGDLNGGRMGMRNVEDKRRAHAHWKRYRKLRDETICRLTAKAPMKGGGGDNGNDANCSHSRKSRSRSRSNSSNSSNGDHGVCNQSQWDLFGVIQQDPFESISPEDYKCFVDICCNENVNPLSPAQIEDVRSGEPLSRVVLSLQEHIWAIVVRANGMLTQCQKRHSSENRMRLIMDRVRKSLDKLQGGAMRDHWTREGQTNMKQLQRWFGFSPLVDDCCSCSDESVVSGSSGDKNSPTLSRMSVSDALETTSIMSSSSLTDPIQESLLGNCIEKWLFEHLYFSTFQITEQDVIHDDDLRKRLMTFRNFIEPLHLGLKMEYQKNPDFDEAVANLRKIDHYTTPSTKLFIVTNAMDAMFKALTACYSNQEDQNSDMMMPATVLLLLRSNPRNLHSNMKFMRMWCDNEKVSFGESGFWYTTIEAAQWFIERATESSFEGLEPNEYARSIKANAPNNSVVTESIVWDWHVV